MCCASHGIPSFREGGESMRKQFTKTSVKINRVSFNFYKCFTRSSFFRPFGRVPGAEVTCQVSGTAHA